MHAIGSGHGLDSGQGLVLTAADGSYTMDVNTREGYAVYVDDKELGRAIFASMSSCGTASL